MSPSNGLVGVVLAGGHSSRMKQNKALLARFDESMLAFTCRQLVESGVSRIIISGTETQYSDDIIKQINVGVPLVRIADKQPNLGPVGGIHSVLSQCGSDEHVILVPVDLPLLTATDLSTLVKAGQHTENIAHFCDHPLPMYIHDVELSLPVLIRQISLQRLAVRSFAQAMEANVIANEDFQHGFNANTPEEWEQALALLTIHSPHNVVNH